MKSDPAYKQRLLALPEAERRALLEGDWNIFEGQYFTEFDRKIHVCEPFKIPSDWRIYRTIDYGLDMLACYWIAVDSLRNAYVFKELCESNLPISDAAQKIIDYTDKTEDVYATLAPPDLWNRSQETGKSKAFIFEDAGLRLTKSNNDREAGWLAIKELLKKDANGEARLHIFSNCTQLIKYLPMLQRDPRKPTDTQNEPHEITHAPDSLRYFAIYWTYPAPTLEGARVRYTEDQLEDYRNASQSEREYLIKKLGGKPTNI
jgi:phage terminase large subunit